MRSEKKVLANVNRLIGNVAVCGALSIGAAVFIGCQSNPEPTSETSTTSKIQSGVPGGLVVETHTVNAYIKEIDPESRLVTLSLPKGESTTIFCGREISNFNQLKVGDLVKAVLTEEVAVSMADADAPDTGGSSTVALAPKGAKPGGMVAQTKQVTATVTAIDTAKHQATLRFPDGTSRTLTVRKDVDLTKRTVGERVLIRTTQTLAVSVEKA